MESVTQMKLGHLQQFARRCKIYFGIISHIFLYMVDSIYIEPQDLHLVVIRKDRFNFLRFFIVV